MKTENKMTNPTLETKINDIHSWWEVPCIAHFCSLFRASFNLIDFDIEDLEEALLTDDASDSGNTLIQELIVRLLRGYYGNNSISTFNYQMFLRRLFRQKCREFNCYNPFDNDMDFQFLPMRTKVEILHMLCDFRLDADDVLDILKDLDSDSLRVHPLGYDANKSAYWYFYGTRLYREDYPKKRKEKEKKRGRKRKRGRNKEEESDEEEIELGSGIWQVVCFTESDWERLAVNTEDTTDKNEQALHQIIEEDFLPEIPKLFQEKERLQRKRFLELHPRKSSRIENLKRRKEEEKQYIDKYKRALMTEEGSDSEADSELSTKKARNARYERWKNRNSQKEDSYFSEDENSDCDSLRDSVRSCNTRTDSGFICGRGRQTNNSLSSVTGEMLIHSSERSRSPEWFDTKQEYLHIGMSKVLNKLKEHEDSWPFLEPVDEEDAPNYYQVVKSPMTLQRMEDKLDSGKYKTLAEFKHDFQLILDNCKQYNGSKNEYTLMGENLEKVFNTCVRRFIQTNNSSEGEDVTENSDFPDMSGTHKKRKRKRHKRSNGKNAEDADKENEEKSVDGIYSFNSLDNETRNADDVLSVESRIGEHKPVKRGKGRPPKNASSVDALEQTLRDINKWLDNTPKVTDPCSASNSPPLLNSPRSEVAADIASSGTSETNNVTKPIPRPSKQPPKDPNKKRSVKENHHKHLQLIKQRRRDIQRTIDRLQPGKSKGNLISTITKTQTKPNTADKPSSSKELIAKTENTHRPKPMLSLGSVLSTDIINLDVNAKKHTFSDNDSLPSEEEVYSENDEGVGDQNEMQAENLALDKPYSDSVCISNNIVEKKLDEKGTENVTKNESISFPESTKTQTSTTEKSDKPKPNLGAWFKAFGAPKTQQTLKKKTESSQFNENPVTPLSNEDIKDDHVGAMSKFSNKHLEDDRYDIGELPPPTPGRFFLYEDDRDQRNVPVLDPSPDLKPVRRQRKLSTGSSVSERSSFSQDPNDPMNSPHPSLDESIYQSPQPYHQSPIHNMALKVGFYQDAFPRCGSDKSNSCSPREPMNSVSPQHPMFSPRDSIASPRDSVCSPREVVNSPRGEPVASPREPNSLSMSSPRSAIASPRYAAVSPRDTYAESMRSPYAKSPVHTPTPNVENTYKLHKTTTASIPSATAATDKPFSIYPVKKRISAELEQTNRQHNEQENKAREQQTYGLPMNHEPERLYSQIPVPIPQHILPPPASYAGEAPPIPISLPHHPAHSHHPTYMDTYAHDSMLMNPYFRKDLYVPGQSMTPPVSSQNSLFIPQNSETLAQSQSHYSPPRQPSPLVSSAYNRGNMPLDFTAPNSAPLPLTNKPNENYSSQYHLKYGIPAESALNFSNKNPQHPFYPPVEAERKLEMEYQRAKVDTPLQPYDSRTVDNVYHTNVAHNYRSSASPFVSPPADYYNGNKASNYPPADLRYSSFSAPSDRPISRDGKQYYQPAQGNQPPPIDPSYVGERSMELLNSSRSTYSQPKLSVSNSATPVSHYNPSYQPAQSALPPPPQPAPPPAKAPRKSSKKKKAAAAAAAAAAALAEPPSSETPPHNPSMYPHYLTGGQAAVPSSQDLKHNGIMPSSAFNFGPPSALKSDYQQYFDNLRNSRFFAESAANSDKGAPPTAVTASNSFPFLQRGNSPSFNLAAQAFINPNTSPCPPSIYSSPYLQRPPDDLLRPMILQQGLMSAAHGGGYPPGYLNMHDPINRSPWL